MFKKIPAALAAAALLGAGLIAVSAPANAVDGQQYIVDGDFSQAGVNLLTDIANTTTDFGHGNMYDPGQYAIAGDPSSLHEAWISLPGGDPMLVVNGFETINQKVIEQVVPGLTCTTPGSNVTFAFSANAMNVLRTDWNGGGNAGANISVVINGVTIGSADLTGNDPGNIVSFVGTIPAAPSFDVAIWNNGTAYTGNDFAIDDISLIQRGDCQPPCVETADTHQWYNFNGNLVGTPALDDPRWHATEGNPRSANHKWENHTDGLPYFVSNGSKGKGDWFKWVTTPGNHCTVS